MTTPESVKLTDEEFYKLLDNLELSAYKLYQHMYARSKQLKEEGFSGTSFGSYVFIDDKSVNIDCDWEFLDRCERCFGLPKVTPKPRFFEKGQHFIEDVDNVTPSENFKTW